MLKLPLFCFLIFKSYTCYSQETNKPNFIEDFNIPLMLNSEAKEFAKQLIDKGVITLQQDTSLAWQKVAIRVAYESDNNIAPFHFVDWETGHYWDTTLVHKNEYPFHTLMYDLHDLALTGTIRCFAYDGSKQYGQHELDALLKCCPDTLSKGTPNEFVNYDILNIGMGGIQKVVIIEEWQQQKNGLIQSKILAVGPIRRIYGDDGNYQGSSLLCWYVLNP